MIWLTWRQHRSEAVTAAVLVAMLGVVALTLGRSMHSAYTSDGISSCLSAPTAGSCQTTIGAFTTKYYNSVNQWLPYFALLPGLLGAVIGASVFGRELEHHTWRMVWTQTIPRTRWLAAKLALLTAALITFGLLSTLLIGWYRAPIDRLVGRFDNSAYDFEGVLGTAHLLCAFGFGVLAGLLIRRTIAATAVSFGAFVALAFGAEFWARPHLQHPVTLRLAEVAPYQSGSDVIPPPSGHVGDWILSSGISDTAGHRYTEVELRAATQTAHAGGSSDIVNAYARSKGIYRWISFQPAGRWWHFQLVEGSLYLMLAVIAVALAVWLSARLPR